MDDHWRSWTGLALVAVGVAALAHGAYGFATFEPSGPPCHFCAVEPGLAGPLLEVMVAPSVAAFGATVDGPSLARSLPGLSGRQQWLLRAGAALPVAGGALLFLAGPYGIVFAAPVVLVGWLLVAVGGIAWGFDAARGLLGRG